MKKYHYVYEITYTDNKKYIGVRSCQTLPKDDTAYVGSSKYTPNSQIKHKTILRVFRSRVKAIAYECFLHKKFNVAMSDDYYNKAIQTSTGFSTEGLTLENCSWLKERSEKAKLCKGSNRTEAQKAGTLKMSITNTGVKNPAKGKKGVTSNRFKPWYLKDPNGVIVEYTDITISDFIKNTDNTPFTRSAIFYASSEKEHTLLIAGNGAWWTVGFLPVPKQNVVCVEATAEKAWWYKEPGKPKVTVNLSQEVFCTLYKELGLERHTIKRGISSGKPITKYKFKGWLFGYV